MHIISLKNISKSYTSDEVKTQVLHNIDLEIKKGEFLSIMGPSGAGKSTLLHILGFLDLQSGGDYFFENKKVNDYREEERAHIRNTKMGFVFQSFNLLPRTSVLENVKLPLLYSNFPSAEWDKKALKAIEAVGLSHRINHEPAQLSGGEKQRTAIARALVCDPEVIFADEPTGNLDSHSGEAVMKIICDLNKKQNRTVVLITHDLHVSRYGDRTIHVIDGKVKEA